MTRSFQQDVIKIWQGWFESKSLLCLFNNIQSFTPTIGGINFPQILGYQHMGRNTPLLGTNNPSTYGKSCVGICMLYKWSSLYGCVWRVYIWDYTTLALYGDS